MDKLKELRKRQNLTQEQIAQILNTQQRTYSGYETGRSEPNIETLCKLADYYGVSLDYLCGHDYSNDLKYLNTQEKEFLKAYLQLNAQNRIKIAGYALGLLAGQDEEK